MGRVFLGWMQSKRQAATQAVSFVPAQGSAMTYAMGRHLRLFHRMARESKFNVTLLAYGTED